MNAKRIPLALMLAFAFYGCGLCVLACWPRLQTVAEPYGSDWLRVATGNIAYWGIYLTVGGMMVGVLPKFHRVRIAGDFIGCGAFFLNLLIQRNSGNVALEVGLVLLMAWSLWANNARHEPIVARWSKKLDAARKLVLCYMFGFALAAIWPVTSTTQFEGWYWSWLAVTGALIIFASLVMLEAGVLDPRHTAYRMVYGSGNVLLTISYLGEFNRAGLILNSSLACLMYAPLLWKSIQHAFRHKEKPIRQVHTLRVLKLD